MIKGILIALLMAVASNGNTYADTLQVTEINDDTVYVVTANGNEFAFDGVEDWQVGDLATITFYDNGTEIVTDDIILKARYSGRMEDFKR